jgi:hypothetical protein
MNKFYAILRIKQKKKTGHFFFYSLSMIEFI